MRFCEGLPARVVRCAVRVENLAAGDLEGLPEPDLIVISKPELYDQDAVLRRFLAKGGFTVVARPATFLVWKAAAPLSENRAI